MADDEDQASKTEEPTDRKLEKLKEDGNVPQSKEVNNLFMLSAMLLAVAVVLPWQLNELGKVYIATFTAINNTELLTPQSVGNVMLPVVMQAFKAMSPFFLLLFVVAYIAGLVQNGPIFSFKSVEPKLSKISVLKGIERMFSMKSVAEFLKSIVKLVIIGGALYLVMEAVKEELLLLVDHTLIQIVKTTHKIAIWMLLAALAVMVVLAIADLLFQRAQYTKEHRMSRKELKDEMKDSDGDPHIKARQRQIRNERAQQRMMQEVPNADVIITNPTHYSIALKYKPDEGMAAPVIAAMGVDHVAMKIREVAKEHNIPFYEDPPLARQIYAEAEVGEEIPLSVYEATAKVIGYIANLKSRR